MQYVHPKALRFERNVTLRIKIYTEKEGYIVSDCTVYIDEAGDLGINRGTTWFVLSAVIVNKSDEASIRAKLNVIKNRLNVQQIHLRKIQDFYKRAVIVQELNGENFTYMNILVDTTKFDITKITNASVAYNYICKYLLQRVSWYLESHGKPEMWFCPQEEHQEMVS